MDNLVDIDALLGDLELEAGDNPSCTPCSSIQPEAAIANPIINGSTHSIANGTNASHSSKIFS